MIEIQALDHLVLRANDAPTLIEFYQNILGCQLERQLPELGLSQLRAGNALIDIVAVDSSLGKQGGAGPKDEAKNLDHFCLTIATVDKQSLLDFLDSHQVVHGDYETRYGSEGYGESVYLNDPEGNIVELKFAKS